MSARLLLGLLVGLGAAGAVGYGVLHVGAPLSSAAAPKTTPTPTTKEVVGGATSVTDTVGIASGWPTVVYNDTGAADYSYNPSGWTYIPVGVGVIAGAPK